MDTEQMNRRRGIAKPYQCRLYEKHRIMVRKLAEKLTKKKGEDVSEAEVIRQAIEAKYLKEG